LTNTYFVEIVKKFFEQNSKVYAASKVTKLKLNTCLETIFILPVPEDEVEKVIQCLNGELLAGIKVPDWIVKKFMKFIGKPITDMCNATLELGICSDR
jgi:hypothetical protein